MKQKLLILLLLIAGQNIYSQPIISFLNKTINLGEVNKSERREISYTYTNKGNAPLLIYYVVSDNKQDECD